MDMGLLFLADAGEGGENTSVIKWISGLWFLVSDAR